MSGVRRQVSGVTCHLSHVFFLFFYWKKNKINEKRDKMVELVGGGSVINGGYRV